MYIYVLYKATESIHSFNRNSQNHMFSHYLVATLAGCGRMLGGGRCQFSFHSFPLVGAGGLSHPHYPKRRVTLSGGTVLRPKLFSWFSQRESTLPPPLLGSSSDGGGSRGGVWRGKSGQR